jgi:hypothetical protein
MAKLRDEEAREIGEGIESGLRGPVLLKWIRQLLQDRAERIDATPTVQISPGSMTLPHPPLGAFVPLDSNRVW